MVYLAGDTQDMLSAEMIFSLKQMKEVDAIGPDKPVTVLALFDPCSRECGLERYVINKSASMDKDCEKLDERDSLKDSLLEFVQWGIENYPADRYMVVLSGHGSGPEGNALLPDQNPVDALTMGELHEIVHGIYGFLKDRPLDILGMSSCLANMAELCHELQPYPEEKAVGSYVKFLVGSEGYEPLTGWPYREIFTSMAEKAGKGARDVARDIVRQYTKYYREYEKANVSAVISALNLELYPDLAKSIAALSTALSEKLNDLPGLKEAVLSAHLKAESYLFGKYVDLGDFCRPLGEIGGEIGDLCRDISRSVNTMVIDSGRCGKRFEFSNGIGIYLPWTPVSSVYESLRFARDTRWHVFLRAEYASRRRGNMVIGVTPEESIFVRGGGPTKPTPCMLTIPG